MADLPRPIVSAVVERGAVSNRITRVRRWRRRPPGEPHRDEPKRYRADAEVRGEAYKVVAISLPVSFLESLDAAAAAARKSRSHMIRSAVARLLADGGSK